tara:strand:- start:19490 stop:19681 length:192 start_codon:yes stop_codon:yes gene_type:complete
MYILFEKPVETIESLAARLILLISRFEALRLSSVSQEESDTKKEIKTSGNVNFKIYFFIIGFN